ncbi:MAG: hypothetical protein LBH40_01980 [Alphaproteobacteria bacterium]|jgi:hypothetical protein|nr:hypothetical protein [Alphaproteobacteria bacterium]
MFFVKSVFVALFVLLAGCSVNKYKVQIAVENNLRSSSGTYYIMDSSANIPQGVLAYIEELLSSNLSSHGFVELKDDTSKESANYLVSIDLIVDKSNQKLQITILDNTSSNLKKVFVGSVIFEGSIYNIDLDCNINSLFTDKKYC